MNVFLLLLVDVWMMKKYEICSQNSFSKRLMNEPVEVTFVETVIETDVVFSDFTFSAVLRDSLLEFIFLVKVFLSGCLLKCKQFSD